MKMTKISLTLALLALATPGVAQVPTQIVVPAGTQRSPAGFLNINSDVWFGDANAGVRHYAPQQPNPSLEGAYTFDADPNFSIGGPPCNVMFCYVGQISRVSDTLALVASPEPTQNINHPFGGSGIYSLSLSPQFSFPVSPLGNITKLAINKGLGGPQPTSIAMGPDGKPYFGNLKNPSLQRLDATLQNVEAVGTALNGKPILSLGFSGADLYMATGDGFYVVSNAPACSGNQNNCGVPHLVAGGAAVAVASDALGHVYFATATGVVSRLTVSTGQIAQVTSGLSFGAGVTAGLGLDRDGNLWIGELTQIRRALAADLVLLP